MPVRSEPIASDKRKPTAIIKSTSAERFANMVIRVGAIALWPLSAAGTVMAINGGWPMPIGTQTTVSGRALLAGLVIQAVLTIFEYGYARNRRSPLWWGPFTADVAATYLGYSGLVIAAFTARFVSAGAGDTLSPLLAHGLLIVLAIFVAYIPEQALVE